ncbi:hypothetical protein A9404_04315 [Halothiobacillus diazotrophicus]|uniref:DUF3592 domain-containing protein n=1 Tax=Halothiobacillus diazotrophicus TaxID=1860122 RepID=A0A191ZFS2_9GAMM|nr:DUF3592 domain-containing protein [Halothiobacillus diazotrophicus]ANJ66702.1 hypothetical protein A9404_04315 [Halothiobacillus diazotrophicus]
MFGLFRNPVIALCLIGFGVMLVYAGHKNGHEFGAMRDHGKTAVAEITRLEWREKKSNHDDRTYSAKVRFTTEDGQVVHEETSIPKEFGRDLRSKAVPAVMTVRYLPESPTTFWDVRTEDSSDAQGAIGGYMLFAGLVMLVLSFLFKDRGGSAGRQRR